MIITWVVVSYGTPDEALRLADEVTAADHEAVVFIACNSSEDYEALAGATEGRTRLEVCDLNWNPGYLGALDAIVEHIDPTSVLVLANSDLEVSPDFGSAIRSGLEANPDAVMLAPRIAGADGLDQNPHLLRPPSMAKLRVLKALHRFPLLADVMRLRRRGHSAATPRPASSGDRIFAGHGSCLVIAPNFRTMGGSFAYPQFLFGEELWLGSEALRLGAPIVYWPQASVEHHEHVATGSRRRGVVARAKYDSLAFWVDNHDLLERSC